MWILAAPAVLAALVLFPRARTVALFVLAGGALWFGLIVSGHAQKITMVECVIGRHAIQTTEWQCDVLLDMYVRLANTPDPGVYTQACVAELDHRLGNGRLVFPLCGSMIGDIFISRRR